MLEAFTIRIKRQDRPDSTPYWENFRLPYEPGLNIISCLQRIAARPVCTDGAASTPVAYEAACLEEVCGSCTMLINGRVRQACSALVDDLISEHYTEICLEPMSKFPVQRDLFVDRRQMFESLKRIKGWIEADGYHDLGPGPIRSQAEQEAAYPLSECMTCGCCVEACPQFGPHNDFIGPAAISQVIYFNAHPIGRFNSAERKEAIMGPGGITDCGNSQNCVKVCPKNIPLTDSIAKASRAATIHAIKRLFNR
jgi:succinate dehydrogenase / fumarate reductase iron-sulfur subunit